MSNSGMERIRKKKRIRWSARKTKTHAVRSFCERWASVASVSTFCESEAHPIEGKNPRVKRIMVPYIVVANSMP